MIERRGRERWDREEEREGQGQEEGRGQEEG